MGNQYKNVAVVEVVIYVQLLLRAYNKTNSKII